MIVLVVDDEPMICQLAEKILTRANFQVLVAEDGQQAIALLTKQSDQISVALIDFFLTDTNGVDLIKHLREISPDLPCILSSGNNPSLTDIPEELRSNIHFLSKPYRPVKLVEMIGTATELASN